MKRYASNKRSILAYVFALLGCGWINAQPFSGRVTNETGGAQTETASVFKLVQTVQVKWDGRFSSDNTTPGGGGNIHYVPATGNFVVIVKTLPPATPIPLPPLTECDNPSLDACPLGTIGYKEYTPDMQPTGKYGYLVCDIGDWNSMLIGNDLYVVKVWNNGPGTSNFWRLFKFNTVTWEKLGTVDVPLEDSSQMRDDGPTMSYINGLVTLSGDYWPGGEQVERGSHHHFVTTDLQLSGGKILKSPDVPFHCPESSLRQLPNGDILIFTAVHYFGALKVLRLDKDWKFIDEHILRQDAFWPIGAVLSGRYRFVGYYETSRWKKDEGIFPVINIGLAAFDADWNLVQDEELTDFDYVPEGQNPVMGDGISVELLGNRLYVSYVVTEFKAAGGISDSRTYVNLYDVLSSDVEEKGDQPEKIALSTGYPNPFNSYVSFNVDMPVNQRLTAVVHDQQGHTVKQLLDSRQAAGTHILRWDGTDKSGRSMASGIYFVQCRSGRFSAVRKVVMIR